MPEVVPYFSKNTSHEIGLHVHPGWSEREYQGDHFFSGDSYLREHCEQSNTSVALKDHPYREQLDMIKTGKDYLQDQLGVEPQVFVAGNFSLNNDTIKALVHTHFTHDCSSIPRVGNGLYNWHKLKRISLPYSPSAEDYQKKGELPILVVPLSLTFNREYVNPEVVPAIGLNWLKACFVEYYSQGIPLFHICLHSPCMTDPYFISAMDELLWFISKHNVTFKFASETQKYEDIKPTMNILPYIFGINKNILDTSVKRILRGCW